MTYQETLAYLYNSAPLFQHVGKAAYKEGLENTLALDYDLELFHYLLYKLRFQSLLACSLGTSRKFPPVIVQILFIE